MANVFDKFDAPGNVFDRFDARPVTPAGERLIQGVRDPFDTIANLVSKVPGVSNVQDYVVRNAVKALHPELSNTVDSMPVPTVRNALDSRAANYVAPEGTDWARMAGNVIGTAPVAPGLGVVAKGIGAPGIASLLESGGLRLGEAATTSALANAALRAGAGALQGGIQSALVNPDQAGTGAFIGAATPLVVYGSGLIGNGVSSALNSGAHKLMKSALKPSPSADKALADSAVQTMLDNGINVSEGGYSKLQGLLSDTNDEIKALIGNSTATIKKSDVTPYLNETRSLFGGTPSHLTDIPAIQTVEDGFMTMPTAPGDTMTVPQAQATKQAIYKMIKSSYGKLGGAEIEANKAIGRGLKDSVANAVPEVSALNAQEGNLLNLDKFLERRMNVAGNKDPLGLGGLVLSNPADFAAFMASRSELLKSLGARGVNSVAEGVNSVSLPNFRYGLLGAPSVMATSP